MNKIIWICGLVSGIVISGSAKASEKPNFILIFCDDLGYGDLGCYGHPSIRTPNLDRLASEGQKWTNFYVADSVCTPSRSALLTGRLPIRNGMMSKKRRVLFPDSNGGLPPSEITIAELLKKAGYTTAAIGKWHLGHLPEFLPSEQGFDSYWGIPYSNDMDKLDGFPNYRAQAQKDANYLAPINQYNVPILDGKEIIERPVDQYTLTKRYTEKSIKFITEHHNEPFFLYLAQSMPHIPLYAGKEFLGKSKYGLYGDVIEEIDDGVGTIVNTLNELGISEKTMIIFTSDNGPWLTMGFHSGSAGELRQGKGTTFEGGMRVPAIFWWPGHLEHRKQTEICSTLDLLPTICSLAGVEIPQDRILDGHNIADFICNKTEKYPRKKMFYWRDKEIFAIRNGPWKAHFITKGSFGMGPKRKEHTPPLLYNLHDDPAEKQNVADLHPEVLAELQNIARNHADSIQLTESHLDY